MVWKPREIDVGLWATLRGLQIGILQAPQIGMTIIWVSPQQRWGVTLKQLTTRIVSRPLKMRPPFSLATWPPPWLRHHSATPFAGGFFSTCCEDCEAKGHHPPVSGAAWVIRIAPQSLNQLLRPLGHLPAA